MLSRIIIILLLFFIPFLSYSQKTNRFRNKQKQGKWTIYYDSAQKHIDNTGRYRNGIPKGNWKYYDEQGLLLKKEKYRFKKIATSFYHPNGKIRKQGNAKIVQDEKVLHFFYYGEWLVYDTAGTLQKKEVYKEGLKISEVNYITSSEKTINDSLTTILKLMNQEIYKYHDSVRLAESTFGKNSKQYQRASALNTLHSSKYLSELDNIILKYGYPGKTLVGKEYAIAFSIISSANIGYKEKYFDLIVESANKGELDWVDVAFFVDKVKVAKKEKQIYGTQYKFDEKLSKVFYYPILEPEKLNERRKKVGLEEENISKILYLEY